MIRETCAACGVGGPEATSMRTMTESGWRLDPRVDSDGRTRYAWCCPTCWERRTGTAPLRGKRKTSG